jgi:predicted alpha/beta superfamily hydrolase
MNSLSPTKFINVILLVFVFSSCKKDVFNPELTKEFKLVAESNGATYNIRVALPNTFSSSTGRYATLYVLDGEEDFAFVANKCSEITEQKGTTNVLVVGIGYGRSRSIDYTPTRMSSVTGGGPQFLNFIETQLVPYMEQQYKADTARSSRIILGHSYGGLFGAFAFSVNNRLFGNYILLSPSLWYDNRALFQFEEVNRIKNKGVQQLIFMGIGNNEERDRMQIPFEIFYQTLNNNYINIELAKNFEGNTGHMDSKKPNIIKGLEYYFENR